MIGIVTGNVIDDRRVGFRLPIDQEISLLHVVQTGSKGQSFSYTMGTGGFLHQDKAAGA
jgi:hypothetical protein